MNVLQRLTGNDALYVLKMLSLESEELADKIEDIALDFLAGVDREEVADQVFSDLDALDVHDVWDQAGPSRDGYRDPHEIAWEMVEQVIEPHLKELKKLQGCELWEAAKECCLGILTGINRYERESTSEFKTWADDAPGEMFSRVLDEFRGEQNDMPSREQVDEYVKEHLK